MLFWTSFCFQCWLLENILKKILCLENRMYITENSDCSATVFFSSCTAWLQCSCLICSFQIKKDLILSSFIFIDSLHCTYTYLLKHLWVLGFGCAFFFIDVIMLSSLKICRGTGKLALILSSFTWSEVVLLNYNNVYCVLHVLSCNQSKFVYI